MDEPKTLHKSSDVAADLQPSALRSSIGYAGLVVTVMAGYYVVGQIARFIATQNLALTYVALVALPIVTALFLWGRFPRWVYRRRSVEEAELLGLYAEVDRYGAACEEGTPAIEHAREERRKLQALERPALELEVLALRQALVELYEPAHELISKTRRELEFLEEYASAGEHDLDEESAKRVNGTIDDLSKILETTGSQKARGGAKREHHVRTLRAELKALRDRVAWYDNTWAIGEWLRTCVTWFVLAALVSSLLGGVLPLIHSEGDSNLILLHWAALGAFGALLSITLQLQHLDLPELGETRGKQLLQGTGRSVAIGAATAVLLYFAIWGEALGGKAFPRLPTDPKGQDGMDVGLSALWAVLAGVSPVILRKLTQLADTTLGEPQRNTEEE